MTIPVAIRLGFEGGQAATRGVEDFGRKGSASFREMKKAASELPPHLVAVSRGVGAVRDKVDDLASRTGAIGNVASSFGPFGLAVSAAAAGVALAGAALYRAAEGAIVMGDAIADASAKAGVSSDTLQELRYAVHATGGEYEDADAAISAFTKTLGQAESGYSRALKPFKQLGFSQQDLKNFATADDALREVARRVSELGKESERQAVSEKLGLGPMIPLLREGADRMAELREQAHSLGYVMDKDLVGAAGDAGDKLEDLHAVIKVQLNSALIEAAPLLLDVAQAMADGAKGARGFAAEVKDLKALIQDWAASHPTVTVAFQGVWKWLNNVEQGFRNAGQAGLEKLGFDKNRLDVLYGKLPRDVGMNDGGAYDDRRTGADGSGVSSSPSGVLNDAGTDEASGKAAAAAERAARKGREARDRTDAAIAAAEARELAAQRTYAGTLEDMLAVELKALDDAEARRMVEIDRQVTEGKLDAARATQLKATEADAFAAEREVTSRKAFEDTQNRRLADEKRLADVTQDLLSLASAGARTAEERRAIELEILASQQKIARAELEREFGKDGDPTHDDAWKDARRADMARLQAAQTAGVQRDNMGPLAAYRDSLIRTNAEVRESLQELAVDGFKTLNDGIVATILSGGKLGDMFGSITDMIVAGLQRVVVQMTIVGPLIDALTKAGSGGGWFGKLVGAAAGALGGSFGASAGVSAASAADLGGSDLASRLAAGRATGGPVYRGDVRPIDEYGIERYGRFSGDGYMVDAARTAREITDQTLSAKSAYGQSAGGGGPISVALHNNAPMPLQASARESDDGMGGRRVEIDIVELIDKRVAKGNRDLFGGDYDSAFQTTFGARRRLNGG